MQVSKSPDNEKQNGFSQPLIFLFKCYINKILNYISTYKQRYSIWRFFYIKRLALLLYVQYCKFLDLFWKFLNISPYCSYRGTTNNLQINKIRKSTKLIHPTVSVQGPLWNYTVDFILIQECACLLGWVIFWDSRFSELGNCKMGFHT